MNGRRTWITGRIHTVCSFSLVPRKNTCTCVRVFSTLQRKRRAERVLCNCETNLRSKRLAFEPDVPISSIAKRSSTSRKRSSELNAAVSVELSISMLLLCNHRYRGTVKHLKLFTKLAVSSGTSISNVYTSAPMLAAIKASKPIDIGEGKFKV